MSHALIMALTALLLGLALGAGGSEAMPASAVRAALIAGRLPASSTTHRDRLLRGAEDWGRPRDELALPEFHGMDAATRLVITFLDNPDPLSDWALMHRLVTREHKAVEDCMAWLKPEDVAHWDALMAAAVYTRQQYGTEGACVGYPVSFPVWPMFRLLQARARPAFTPQVVQWLHDPSLAALHNDQAALLARCGGAGASIELVAYYESLQAKRHAVLKPKALVRPPPTVEEDILSHYNSIYRETGLWAEASGTGGVKYALFPAAGLISDRDLYLAVDAQPDGVWDEVLPTGLEDMCFTHTHPGGAGGPGPKGKLEFTVADGAVRIMHHQPVIEDVACGEGTNQWTEKQLTGANRVATLIKLDDLRKDTDGDGLTDVLEKLLFLDPTKPDTDGDEIKDAEDAAPLADPALMGPVERGIARALAFITASDQNYWWWDTSLEHGGYTDSTAGQPWSARYLLVHGCGPVDYSCRASTYSICLNTPSQRDAYRAALQLYPPMSAVEVSWTKRGMKAIEAWQASRQSDTKKSPGFYEASRWRSYLSQPFRKQPAAALIVHIDYWIFGSTILLLELDGEYYPYAVPSGWVS